MSFGYAFTILLCSPYPVHITTYGFASSAFARHYSRNLVWFLFLRVLRCFSSPGSPRNTMDSCYAPWLFIMGVSPFGHPRIKHLFAVPRGLSQLVASFFGSWCQGIRPVLLFAWTFLRVPFRKRLLFSELLEFHKQILFGIHIAVKRFFLFMLLESFHLAVKLYLPSFGKTKSSFDANLLKILSSKSVRFYSSICFIRFSMNTVWATLTSKK